MANDAPSQHKNNLIASLNYAERLANQVPVSVAEHGVAIIELVLISRILLNQDIARLDGLEIPDTNIHTLLKSACGRLGYDISLRENSFALKHYEIEIRLKTRAPFKTTVSCPEIVAIDLYIPLRFGQKEPDYESYEIIREINHSEWIQRNPRKTDGEKLQNFSSASAVNIPVGFSSEEQVLLYRIRESGLLKVFEETVVERNDRLAQGASSDIAREFLTFLQSAVKMKLAPPVLQLLIAAFGGQIVVYKAQQIAMVVSNGEIKMFLSTKSFDLSIGKASTTLRLNGLAINRKKPDRANVQPLPMLLRSRKGYVPASAHIFAEALLHSVGSFGREMKPIPMKKEE